MKQFIFSIAIVALTSFSQTSSAQKLNDVPFNYLVPISVGLSIDKSEETKVVNVAAKAVRNFTRSHKNVNDAKWFKTDKGYSASFSSKEKNTKIIYDTKGGWQYNIVSYTEENLDAAIRHQVKSKYYDNTIIGVHQFEFPSGDIFPAELKTVYVVKMLDGQSNPCTITICDGQINDITSKK